MRRGLKNPGFTLIELMIVIAIIAVIAAIAIPGLISSQRSSNERNASASLKTLASAEIDFRGNDRDGNKVQDFWTLSVNGLFTLSPVGNTEPIKLIELSVALADTSPLGGGPLNTANSYGLLTNYGLRSAKAAYWYRAMITDENGLAYARVTNGGGLLGAAADFNVSKFAFWCFPDSRSAGRNVFIINEGNTIYKRGVATAWVSLGAPYPVGIPAAASLVGAIAPVPTTWPTDAQMAADYGKMD